MDNQEQTQAKPRKMIHLQCAGDFSQDQLIELVKQFQEASLQDGVIATPANVTATIFETENLSGAILTPKMTAKEVANVVVAALRGYDVGVGNPPTLGFEDLEQDQKVEILSRIQFVMRYYGLPVGEDGKLSVRDAIFVETVNALRNKFALPETNNVIQVTRIAQKEDSEDEVCSFIDLRKDDVFTYQDHKFVATSDPFVNWIADPLPVISLDAEEYKEPAPVPADEVKASTPSKKKVQSNPSKAKVHHRKK